MSKHDWLGNTTLTLIALSVTLAIGGIVYAISIEQYIKRHEANVSYQQNAESDRHRANEEIAKTCFQSDFARFRDCISDHLETYYEERADSQDLKAQHDMAYWAGAIFFLGVVQAFIALAGIYYVAGNLRITSMSVQLANKAIIVENRPWVNLMIGPPFPIFITSRGLQTSLRVRIVNVGGSPAQRVHVECAPVYFGSCDPIADIKSWLNDRIHRYKTEMWDRSLFVGVDMEIHPPAFMPSEMIERERRESGIDLINPQFVVAVFYQTGFDDAVHYTASLHEIGHRNDLGGMRAISSEIGTIPDSELVITNFNGLVVAT